MAARIPSLPLLLTSLWPVANMLGEIHRSVENIFTNPISLKSGVTFVGDQGESLSTCLPTDENELLIPFDLHFSFLPSLFKLVLRPPYMRIGL